MHSFNRRRSMSKIWVGSIVRCCSWSSFYTFLLEFGPKLFWNDIEKPFHWLIKLTFSVYFLAVKFRKESWVLYKYTRIRLHWYVCCVSINLRLCTSHWNPRTLHLGNVRGTHFIRMWKSAIYPATRAKQYGDSPCPRGIDLAL